MFTCGEDTARAISEFGSRFSLSPIARGDGGRFQVVYAHLGPDGLIGSHQARLPQVLLVVAGSGWVRGEGPERHSIEAGQAVAWNAGEWHETGTVNGLTAVIVEGVGIEQ